MSAPVRPAPAEVRRRGWRDPRTRRAVRAGALAVSLGLIAYTAALAVRHARVVHLHAAWLVPAALAASGYWLGLAGAWAAITGSRPAAGAATWVRTQALRYLPGGVWGAAARAGSVAGAPRRRVGLVLVEAALTPAVALVAAALAWAIAGHWWAAVALAAVAGAGWVARRRLEAVRGWVVLRSLPVLRRSDGPLPGRPLVAPLPWYAAGWAAYGVASWAAQRAVGPVAHPFEVVAAGYVAWLVGYVAVFAPGGAGVREAVYVAVLAGTMPTSRLAAASLLARAVFVVVELLALAGVLVAGRWTARREPRPAEPEPAEPEPAEPATPAD